MVSIEQFGYYAIAATVAMGSLQLIHPLIQALLPRAIQFRNDPVRLRSLSIKLMRSIALLIGLAFIIFATIGRWLLEVWLRSPEAVNVIYPLLTILLIGTALNAFYNVGYLNWLVHKKIQRVFQVNALSLVISVLLIPPLVSSLGIKGAATGWLAINLIGFIFSLEWIKR
jgi:O-antigen/teichoic acid export membrane protein